MNPPDPHQQYQRDEATLAEIGAVLFQQDTDVVVRLPRHLADRALAAWEQNDPGVETGGQAEAVRASRQRAGALALIGLAVRERGVVDGDEVVVSLDAWEIGDAFSAADDRNMLRGRRPTSP